MSMLNGHGANTNFKSLEVWLDQVGVPIHNLPHWIHDYLTKTTNAVFNEDLCSLMCVIT